MLVEIHSDSASIENSMKVPPNQKQNCWMIQQSSGYTPKGNEKFSRINIHTSMLVAAFFTITKIFKHWVFFDRWIKKVLYTDKEVIVYRYNGILFSHEEKRNSSISNNMDESWVHSAKWDVRQIKINALCYHLYVEYEKTNL